MYYHYTQMSLFLVQIHSERAVCMSFCCRKVQVLALIQYQNQFSSNCITTVQLKGNVALARSFTLSRLIHSIEQRVWRVASQANSQLDTLEKASFGIHLLALASTYLLSLN